LSNPSHDIKTTYLTEMEPILALIKKNCSFEFPTFKGYIELHNHKQLMGTSGAIHLEDGNFVRFHVQNGKFEYMTTDEELLFQLKSKLEIQLRILIDLNRQKEELNEKYFSPTYLNVTKHT
jgi:hypothetical protein